jgi:hypothetical protein
LTNILSLFEVAKTAFLGELNSPKTKADLGNKTAAILKSWAGTNAAFNLSHRGRCFIKNKRIRCGKRLHGYSLGGVKHSDQRLSSRASISVAIISC